MIAATYRKIVIRQNIAAFLFIAFLLIHDVVLDLLLSGLYITYEMIELGSEELVHYLFHTTHHESETIFIYSVVSILLYFCYRFIRSFPVLLRRFKRKISIRWVKKKSRIARYWHAFSTYQKIMMVTFYSVGASLLVVWLFFL